MSSINMIKISELDRFPTASQAVASDDFFPLVDSSSLTTYRIALSTLAQSSPFAPVMNVSSSVWAQSASYASSSVSSSYSATASTVNIYGEQYYVPSWTTANTPGANGSLSTSSPLFVSYSALAGPGLVIINFDASTGSIPNINRSDYTNGPAFRWYVNTPSGSGISASAGIWTSQPVVSTQGFWTDRALWYFSTGSGDRSASNLASRPILTSFWSGSSANGFWATITQSSGPTAFGIGAISHSFNGKWVRIAASSNFGGAYPYQLIASHSAYGEDTGLDGLYGRVKLTLGTTGLNSGSNSNQQIDMQIHNAPYGGGITAQILHSSVSGLDHIRKMRLSVWTTASTSDTRRDDPVYALDVYIDALTLNDYVLSLQAQAFGGLRFLSTPNVDPVPLMDTASAWGHTDPRTATYLEFPAAPGYYSTIGATPTADWNATGKQPYYFQGKRIYITPNRNEVTESAYSGKLSIHYKPYTLYASGSISTQKYYADDSEGQSGTAIAYDAQTAEWKKWVYKSGLLIDSSSAASNPNGGEVIRDTMPVGTILAWAGGTTIPNNFIECDGTPRLTASFWALHQAILNQSSDAAYGYTCSSTGVRGSTGSYFMVPDLRGEFLRGYDNGRGIDTSRALGSAQSANLGTHYHGMGAFGDNTNDNAYFIYRSWTDDSSRYARLISGNVNLDQYTTLTNPNYGISTGDPVNDNGNDIRPRNTAVIYIIKYAGAVDFATTSSTLAGDVTGLVTATTVEKIRNVTVDSTVPTDGQILQYSSASAKWVPTTPAASRLINEGKSWLVSYPGGVLNHPDGDYIYVFNYNRHDTITNMVKLNMLTNEVSYQCTASNDDGTSFQWQFYGRHFSTVGIPAATGSAASAYYFSTLGLHWFEPNSGSMRKLDTIGNTYDLPVSISFNAASGSMPTIWCLRGSYGAGTNGNYPSVKFYHYTWKPTPGNGSFVRREADTVDLSLIQNSTEFLKFMRDSTTSNLLMWDYNVVNGRFYIIDTSTGYLHILTSVAGGQFLTNFNASVMTYYKTFAIPSVGNADWSNPDTEKYLVDYDPVTGDERGITYLRRSNDNLQGVVAYAVWPE
jgi:hypothetical protein